MTIKKYVGDKITGLSSDTKPTAIPDGATFYETDTGKIYIRTGAAWVQATYLRTDTTATLNVGYSVNSYNLGTLSSGSTTLNPALGNLQYYTNNGAHSLVAPGSDCVIDILITNGASAGAVTFSGFTVGANTGGSLTTTNTNKFVVTVKRINSVATYSIYALQ